MPKQRSLSGRNCSQSSSKNKAFQLAEVLVAGMIFFVFAIPFFGLLTTTRFDTARQKNRIEALFIAHGILEELRHNSREYNSLQSSSLPRKYPPEYKITKTFANWKGNAPFKVNTERLLEAIVKIEWKERQNERELTLNSLISTVPAVCPRKRRR